MKNLVIIGAGDFAREVSWLVERINRQSAEWNLLGFVDDGEVGACAAGYPVLGKIDWLCRYTEAVWAVCAVGTGAVRKRIWERLKACKNVHPAVLIDPAAVIGRDCEIGGGSIICAGTVLTVDVKVGAHCIINLNCTLGHDCVLEPCCTVNPGTNISGKVHVGECTDIGTGTKLVQGKTVAPNVILGAGAVVSRDIRESGTYVGVPARKVNKDGLSK